MPCFTFPSAGRMGQTSPPSQPERIRSGHRYYVPLRLPPDRLRVVRFSLSFPDTLPSPSFVVCVSAFADSPQRRGLLRDAGISPPGRTSSSYLSSLRRETDGSLKFPDYPRKYMPWSQTPVVSRILAIFVAFGTAAFRYVANRRLSLPVSRKFILMTTSIPISGLSTDPVFLPSPASDARYRVCL